MILKPLCNLSVLCASMVNSNYHHTQFQIEPFLNKLLPLSFVLQLARLPPVVSQPEQD